MTISPGDPWGSLGHLPVGTPVINSDAALADLVSTSNRKGVLAALSGGDLCRTLGCRGDVAAKLGGDATLVDINVGEMFAGDQPLGPFVAHMVLRGWGWSGASAVVMNAQWMGEWDMAPRAHPGDGLFDVIEGELGSRERLLARKRVRSGDHLPHPQLRSRRSASCEFEFDRPRLLVADGVKRGRHRHVRVQVRQETVLVAV